MGMFSMFNLTWDPTKGGITRQRILDSSTIFFGLWGRFEACWDF